MSKVFNLEKDYKFTNDVQNNVRLLKKMFGSRFKIKNKKITVPVRLVKEKFRSSGFTFYTLAYDQPNRLHSLLPFKISFRDVDKLQSRNNTYIANIHRTDKISGSKMVLFVLAVQKKLNVSKTVLFDGANIKCDKKEMMLSTFKMIEKYRTFYMKFGFEMSIKSHFPLYSNIDKKQQQAFLKELIDNIRAIKIKDVINNINKTIDILAEAVKENDYKNFKVQECEDPGSISNIELAYKLDAWVDIPKIFTNCYEILNILNKTKEKSLYKYMIKLFNDKKKCSDYLVLWEYFNDHHYYIISYKKTSVEHSYIELFRLLVASVHWGRAYAYVF